MSKDTLLRVVRRRVSEQDGELSVIGIDDFAFRRGQTYGTIVCDLERRRPVALLPDRALNTSRNWLAERPSISIVARDRGGGYGEAIVRALPDAAQVADRWHLMENSSRAFLDAVSKSMQSPKTKEFLMMLLDADAGYLTLINTFTVEPEKADYLVAALSATTKTFLVGKPGFISANLHVSLDGKHVANYAQWRSKEDMDAAMLDPAIQAGIREAVGFATGFAPILYRLAETHTAQS